MGIKKGRGREFVGKSGRGRVASLSLVKDGAAEGRQWASLDRIASFTRSLRRARGTVLRQVGRYSTLEPEITKSVAASNYHTICIACQKPPNLAYISDRRHFYNPVVSLSRTVLISLDWKLLLNLKHGISKPQPPARTGRFPNPPSTPSIAAGWSKQTWLQIIGCIRLCWIHRHCVAFVETGVIASNAYSNA